LYQHSTFIESKRYFSHSTTIEHYAVLADSVVLVITNTFWAEIYGLKSLDKEPLFRLHLRYPTCVFLFDENTFILITNDGSIRYLTQQPTKTSIKFTQTSNQQLKIKCSRLLCSLLTLQSKPSLIILDDDQNSLAICTVNEILTMDINLTQSSPIRLLHLTSDKTEENLLFYFEDKSLLTCRIRLSNPNSYHLESFGTADIYCLKKNCLATVINGENRLNLHDINSNVCYEAIELENECEQLCVNESGEYAFALVKPRILCMYRLKDHQRIGRLFVYDYVTTMIASNDFIILALNDRRLLTLMIADPDDPTLQSKIQALPSRNLKRDSHSAGKNIVEQIEKFHDMSSDDYDSDIESDKEMNDKQLDTYKTKQTNQPITSYRCVYRLNGKLSLSKMKTDESYGEFFSKTHAEILELAEASKIVIDDSDDDDDGDVVIENQSPVVDHSNEQQHNLDDIREKTVEYDRQQMKGIQLANAGANNLRITNNYSVTSSTCTLL
jgi:hypothetical protein